MIFTLIVTSDHLNNNFHALETAKAILTQQEQINCIYFLFNGAYTANKYIDMPSDEYAITQQWQNFAQEYNLPMLVCKASALRRGIDATNMATGFRFSSIGELVAACDLADRVIRL